VSGARHQERRTPGRSVRRLWHTSLRSLLIAAACIVALTSCRQEPAATGVVPRPDELFRVGSIVVYQKDLDRQLTERFAGRTDDKARTDALELLVRRARFTQAALDAGLDDDPLIRDQVGRLLEARFRETELDPALKQALDIPDERLREIYQTRTDTLVAPEKRQVAVLWLNSSGNPDKERQFSEKLAEARVFALQDPELRDHPERGFSVLGADYSEHHASRFKGGLVGWLERSGGFDPWTKAVTEIAFGLEEVGAVSEVTTTPQGVFLVRLASLQPKQNRSFDSVRAELQHAEQARLRAELTERFEQQVLGHHEIIWTSTPPSPGNP
jgi:hypothetical protein